MKKKLTHKLHTVAGIWLLGALSVLAGCYDVINPSEENDQTAPSEGLGRVVLSIGEGQENARTLMPAETPVFTKYDLTFTAGGKATVTRSLTSDNDKNSVKGTGYSLDLEPAAWTVTATAYTGTGGHQQEAASGTKALTVITGGTSSVNISLAPLAIADGKPGRFSWSLNTGGITGGTSGRTATLTPVKNGVKGNSISLYENTGSRELESGYYDLVIQFEKTVNGTVLKAGIYEAVHIYPGLTTRAEYTFTDAHFAAQKKLAGTVNIELSGQGTVERVMVQAYKEEGCYNAVSSEFTALSSPWNWFLEVPSEYATIWFKITAKLAEPNNAYIAKAKLESIPLKGKANISLAALIKVEQTVVKVDLFDLTSLVTAPVAGASPVTTGINATQYTGTVAWQTSSGSAHTGIFASATVYKAVLTLTAKSGYTFTDVNANAFSYSGATSVTNSANSGTVTITFPQTSDFTWTDSNGEITITGYRGTSSNVVIPARIDNKPVTSIRGVAFRNKQLTSVIIPSSVVSIGYYAFAENQLISVTFEPDSRLTSIEANSFYKNQLTSVTIPSSVVSIERQAFSENQLDRVTIPSSVTSIGYYAFEKNRLTSVTFEPESQVTSIEICAFNNNQLDSVTIPSSVISIGDGAFLNNQLTSVTFEPESQVTSIGDHAFCWNQLDRVTIPSSVISIGWSAFGSNQLTNVTFESGSRLTSIGNTAFHGNQLTNVTIPSLVASIGNSAFAENQLTSVTIGANVDIVNVNSFDGNLRSTYNNNSKRSGKYTRASQDSVWMYAGQ